MEYVPVPFWILCIVIGGLIGRRRGRVESGLIWALFLGPIGWLVVALQEDLRPKCGECGGVIVPGARKCMHCGSAIIPKVAIRCPACGQRGELPETRMAEELECPSCKRVFTPTAAKG